MLVGTKNGNISVGEVEKDHKDEVQSPLRLSMTLHIQAFWLPKLTSWSPCIHVACCCEITPNGDQVRLLAPCTDLLLVTFSVVPIKWTCHVMWGSM